ncbi:hypothetical protein ACWEOE_41780 [Amycolatopsis sp. NPDC004368]
MVLFLLGMSTRIGKQFGKGVKFRPGRVTGVREPGLRFVIPVLDVLRKASLSIVTMPIQSRGIILALLHQYRGGSRAEGPQRRIRGAE